MTKRAKLVICSGKGGVGKSMLTSALATLFSKIKKVVAVDCDADAPNLAIWLGGIKKWDKTIPVVASAKPEIDYKKCNGCGLCAKNCRFSAIKIIDGKPKLNQFLCEGCGACEVICPQGAIKLKPVQNGKIKIKKIKQGFPLVSGNLLPGETGSGKVVAEIKKQAEKFEYDLALIDSAPGTGCPVIASLQGANFVILITEPTPSGFSDLKRVLEVVNHFNIAWGLVINKWDINKTLSQKIEKIFKGKFLGKISYDKKIFTEISKLTPILETNLKAKREIKTIFKKLNKLNIT
jgi:MinD superfamily P-loop ATPase